MVSRNATKVVELFVIAIRREHGRETMDCVARRWGGEMFVKEPVMRRAC
jgi:hypothetical protein